MAIAAKQFSSFLGRALFLVFAVTMSATALYLSPVTHATDLSWASSPDPAFSSVDANASISEVPNDCHSEDNVAMAGSTGAYSTCFYHGSIVKVGMEPGSFSGALVAYPGDTKYYHFNAGGVRGGQGTVVMPGTDTVHYTGSLSGEQGYVAIYKNFSSRLKKLDGTQYDWNKTNPDYELKDEQGNWLPTKAAGHSQNGKWVAVEALNKGIALIDVEHNTAKLVSRHLVSSANLYSTELSVSNDGKHIALTARFMQLLVVDVSATCGDPITTTALNSPTLAQPCSERDLSTFLASKLDYSDTAIKQPHFSDDGGELRIVYTKGDTFKQVTLTAPGYTPPPRLDYLALGDSYSSGEGDLGKKPDGSNYYMSSTAQNGGCHLSTRSYPYLLQTYYGIFADKMKSVACSGAETKDIQSPKQPYLGQGDRLGSLTNEARVAKQALALDIFDPGFEEQLKFVNRYKPKAITLTIGGNDVGFEGVIKACADITSIFTCSYANEDELRGQLGNSIKNAFKKIKQSIELLQSASPDSRIFLLGYPQFIYEGTAICGTNIGVVDSEERLMMTQGVSYMNKIIEAVTRNRGVVYVNLENSLAGGRMCESNEYVTGVDNVGLFNSDMYSSTFHPNARGHAKMAETIEQQLQTNNLLNYPYTQSMDNSVVAPEPSPYFATAMANYNRSAQYKKITSQSTIKGQPTTVSGQPYTLKKVSTFQAKTYSDPIDLGSFTANDDGSFNAQITFPTTLPVGFHTLVLSGESYSGEPIDLYQVIEVQGSNPNDRDEDGVDDSIDPCMYIPPSNQDQDADGIDDACDPEIGTAPAIPTDPYRLRAGESTKTYAGSAEQANALYLERNIYATDKTGISGDYDPDHDGWVVIATNQPASGTSNVPTTPPLAPYARFRLEDITVTNNGMSVTTKLPHISFRTANNGCTQYKPASLSKVTEAEVTASPAVPRLFTQEAVDTNTCRTEPPEADTDNNGQSDNTQPLYMARRGDTTKGEDATKLYLFRSTRAAEAQLGKSDYAANDPALLAAANINPTTISPTDTKDYRQAWSLLATSPTNTYTFMNNFAKLKMINNYPYVLTGYTSQFYTNCSAYKPQMLDTIGRTTQATRQLQADWMTSLNLTLGGNCNG